MTDNTEDATVIGADELRNMRSMFDTLRRSQQERDELHYALQFLETTLSRSDGLSRSNATKYIEALLRNFGRDTGGGISASTLALAQRDTLYALCHEVADSLAGHASHGRVRSVSQVATYLRNTSTEVVGRTTPDRVSALVDKTQREEIRDLEAKLAAIADLVDVTSEYFPGLELKGRVRAVLAGHGATQREEVRDQMADLNDRGDCHCGHAVGVHDVVVDHDRPCLRCNCRQYVAAVHVDNDVDNTDDDTEEQSARSITGAWDGPDLPAAPLDDELYFYSMHAVDVGEAIQDLKQYREWLARESLALDQRLNMWHAKAQSLLAQLADNMGVPPGENWSE